MLTKVILEEVFVDFADKYVPGQAPLVPEQEEESKDNFRPSEDYANESLAKIQKKQVTDADLADLSL